MKKLLTVLMVTMVVLGLCTFAVSAEQLVDVTINGVEVDFDVPAQVINDRTLVPLRGIFEVLGAQVNWDNDTETVTASKGDIEISLQIGSTSLFVNGEEKVLDVPAQLVNDRTLIPARAVAESFGATVDWDDPNQTVIITDPTCPDFKAMLDKAMTEEFECDSVEAAINMAIDVTVEEENVNLDLGMDLKTKKEPLAAEITIKVNAMGEEQSVAVYMAEDNGKYYTYAVEEADGKRTVSKQEIDKPETITEGVYLGVEGYEDYIKVASQEKVGEKDTVKYVLSFTGAELNDMLKDLGADAVLEEYGLTEIFTPESKLNMYIWVDKSNGLAYKFNVDVVDMLISFFDSIGITEGVAVDACALDIEITGINTVEKIVIPEDVK